MEAICSLILTLIFFNLLAPFVVTHKTDKTVSVPSVTQISATKREELVHYLRHGQQRVPHLRLMKDLSTYLTASTLCGVARWCGSVVWLGGVARR